MMRRWAYRAPSRKPRAHVRWYRNQDDALELRGPGDVMVGGVWLTGGGWRAVVRVDGDPLPWEHMAPVAGKRDAMAAVEAVAGLGAGTY